MVPYPQKDLLPVPHVKLQHTLSTRNNPDHTREV